MRLYVGGAIGSLAAICSLGCVGSIIDWVNWDWGYLHGLGFWPGCLVASGYNYARIHRKRLHSTV